MKKPLFAALALAAALAAPGVQAQTQKLTGNAGNGAGKTQMCVGCHGIVGYQASFPEVHKVPKIAGQSATYIASALAAYKNGDRRHPTMRAIADSLSEQDIADLAAYYGALGLDARNAPPAAVKAPSRQVQALLVRDSANTCTKCHGVNFNTPNDPTVAKLAGQHADYLVVALKAYKTANHPMVGRANGVMAGQAKNFSNAEIQAIAAYISALPGELKTVPESVFH